MSDNYNNMVDFLSAEDPFDVGACVNGYMDPHHNYRNENENMHCMTSIGDENIFLVEDALGPSMHNAMHSQLHSHLPSDLNSQMQTQNSVQNAMQIPVQNSLHNPMQNAMQGHDAQQTSISTASSNLKTSLKCAREKDNCYTNQFPEFLFKKPHKYDLKMLGPIDHNDLSVNLCVVGEREPIFEEATNALTTELCVVNETECIVRFCLLVCSHSLGGKSLELIATVGGTEIFRSNSFKCLARKRARHSKVNELSTIGEKKAVKKSAKKDSKKSSGKRKRPVSVCSPSDSISSPASPASEFVSAKRIKLESAESPLSSMGTPYTPENSNSANSVDSTTNSPNNRIETPNNFQSASSVQNNSQNYAQMPGITWDLFQLICNMNSGRIEQEGGNSRVHLAINLLNALNSDEREFVLNYYTNPEFMNQA